MGDFEGAATSSPAEPGRTLLTIGDGLIVTRGYGRKPSRRGIKTTGNDALLLLLVKPETLKCPFRRPPTSQVSAAPVIS